MNSEGIQLLYTYTYSYSPPNSSSIQAEGWHYTGIILETD